MWISGMAALGTEIDGGWIGTRMLHIRCGGRIFEARATYSAYHCCCGAKPKLKENIWGLRPTSVISTEGQERTTKPLFYKQW